MMILQSIGNVACSFDWSTHSAKFKISPSIERKIDREPGHLLQHTLKKIYLIGNDIGDRRITKFADELKQNETLEVVGLSNNQIGDNGVASLADALETNHSIRKLYLSTNLIKLPRKKIAYTQ